VFHEINFIKSMLHAYALPESYHGSLSLAVIMLTPNFSIIPSFYRMNPTSTIVGEIIPPRDGMRANAVLLY
jgi:hypothetical protein